MFSRIRDKLFLALFGANAVLALFMFLGSSLSFERQFHDYLMQQEDQRLDSLVGALGAGYEQRGNWSWITGNRALWFALIRQYLSPEASSSPIEGRSRGPDRPFDEGARPPPPGPRLGGDGRPPPPDRRGLDDYPPRPDRGFPGNPPPPDRGRAGGPRQSGPVDSLTLGRFILLLDEQKNVIEGPPQPVEPLELKPIHATGKLVGYLGFQRRPELAQAIDSVFARQQRSAFIELALAMLVTSIVVAAGIAYYLAKPIRRLRRSTNALTEGKYETRTPVRGRDEFAQLAGDFNELARTLQANRDARRQWIADISHELRTPIAVLKGEVHAIEDGIRELSHEHLASFRQEIDRLSQLVDDLHVLSLAELGGLSYRKSRVDLGSIVRDVLDVHGTSLGEAGIDVRCDVAGDNTLFGDSARLSQLVSNLVQNTCRYTDGPGQLRIAVHGEENQVTLDWNDSKPGVRDEDLPRLTDRLFRIDSSRNRETGGSGLGLAIAQAIVEAQDGSMQARHSDLGGLWWHITFPRSGARATS